jgi:hypothetical protein
MHSSTPRLARRALTLGAGLLLSLLSAGRVPAQEPQGPIAIQVTTSLDLERKKGLGRLWSEVSRGDVGDSARELERILVRYRWARVVSDAPEMLLVVESRERDERGRWQGKDGETVEHLYAVEATLEVGDDRVPLRAEQEFRQGPKDARNDWVHFGKAAEKLVGEIAVVVTRKLPDLRPAAPEAGFTHEAKYRFLIKGDGLEVTWVAPGSPAERAGLQVKDRIRRIDGEKGTNEMDERAHTWWLERTGTRVALEVERSKQRRPVELTLLPRSRWGDGEPVR